MENEILDSRNEPCDECGGITSHRIMHMDEHKLLGVKEGWYKFTECLDCHDEYRVTISVEDVIENFTRQRNQLNRRIATLKKASLKQ